MTGPNFSPEEMRVIRSRSRVLQRLKGLGVVSDVLPQSEISPGLVTLRLGDVVKIAGRIEGQSQ
jgi:hypothetical protein